MKPKISRFEEVARACDGNISSIADGLGVNRSTIHRWIYSDQAFARIVEDCRGRLLDRCIKTAGLLANGIPRYDEKGEFCGWKVAPEPRTLNYLLGTLGRKEGFGESLDITSNGESIKTEPITIEVIDRRGQVDNDLTQE